MRGGREGGGEGGYQSQEAANSELHGLAAYAVSREPMWVRLLLDDKPQQPSRVMDDAERER